MKRSPGYRNVNKAPAICFRVRSHIHVYSY